MTLDLYKMENDTLNSIYNLMSHFRDLSHYLQLGIEFKEDGSEIT